MYKPQTNRPSRKYCKQVLKTVKTLLQKTSAKWSAEYTLDVVAGTR